MLEPVLEINSNSIIMYVYSTSEHKLFEKSIYSRRGYMSGKVLNFINTKQGELLRVKSNTHFDIRSMFLVKCLHVLNSYF